MKFLAVNRHSQRLIRITRYALLMTMLVLAACQPSTPPELPTLAVLSSETPTDAPTDTPAPPTATPTITRTPSPTATLPPTSTPRFTNTPTETIEPTVRAIGSATRAVQEAPRLSTLTAVPGVSAPTGTPQLAADVIITEAQFQEEVNLRIRDIPAIQSAIINFVPDGIRVQLTALGGQAFMTGEVLVSVLLTGDFATITISEITVNAPEPPPEYIATATGEFFTLMIESLDSILKARLGDEQNLQTIRVTDSVMEIMLLVPQQ